MKTIAVLACAVVVRLASVSVVAHQETHKGKVLSIDKMDIRVNVVDPKTKKIAPRTFVTDAETKILRGDKVVTWATAKIRVSENIAITTDHDLDEDLALVIRLDPVK